MHELVAYKVMTAEEYARFRRDGVFPGSPVDVADGFIHLSTARQLTVTVDRHFAGQADLVVAAVDLSRLGDTVRWEPSRGGDLFPHIHGPLPLSAVTAEAALTRLDDGSVKLPG